MSETEDEILVITTDGKGVAMRREDLPVLVGLGVGPAADHLTQLELDLVAELVPLPVAGAPALGRRAAVGSAGHDHQAEPEADAVAKRASPAAQPSSMRLASASGSAEAMIDRGRGMPTW